MIWSFPGWLDSEGQDRRECDNQRRSEDCQNQGQRLRRPPSEGDRFGVFGGAGRGGAGEQRGDGAGAAEIFKPQMVQLFRVSGSVRGELTEPLPFRGQLLLEPAQFLAPEVESFQFGAGGGEIAEDVAGYFVESEQIPTACALGVLVDRDQSVKAAGGYLIQLMPGAAEDTIAKVEGGIMAAGAVSAILEKNDDPEAMLRTVMSDFDLKILETCPVEYRCYCSRERVERALISLGREELEQMLSEQGGCQLTCQFCDAVYEFTAEDIQRLLKNL